MTRLGDPLPPRPDSSVDLADQFEARDVVRTFGEPGDFTATYEAAHRHRWDELTVTDSARAVSREIAHLTDAAVQAVPHQWKALEAADTVRHVGAPAGAPPVEPLSYSQWEAVQVALTRADDAQETWAAYAHTLRQQPMDKVLHWMDRHPSCLHLDKAHHHLDPLVRAAAKDHDQVNSVIQMGRETLAQELAEVARAEPVANCDRTELDKFLRRRSGESDPEPDPTPVDSTDWTGVELDPTLAEAAPPGWEWVAPVGFLLLVGGMKLALWLL